MFIKNILLAIRVFSILLFSVPNLAFLGLRQSSGTVASRDILASSSDSHSIGTNTTIWRNFYGRYHRLSESADAPSTISSFGTIYVKSSDGFPYFVNDSGTEYALASSDPSNVKTVTANTASTDLTAAQSGRIFTNTASSSSVDYTLPAVSGGANYQFILTNNRPITIRPQAGEYINLLRNISGDDAVTVPASRDRVMGASVGASIVLTSASSDNWTVTSLSNGPWVDIN